MIEVPLSTSWIGSGLPEALSIARPPALVLTVVSLAVLLPAALTIYLVLRDVPIHSKK